MKKLSCGTGYLVRIVFKAPTDNSSFQLLGLQGDKGLYLPLLKLLPEGTTAVLRVGSEAARCKGQLIEQGSKAINIREVGMGSRDSPRA